MTRFNADSEEDRRTLFADAIAAHRARESPFCTFEVDTDDPAWIQVGGDTLNLDCTDGELDRLKSLLNEFSAFSIEGLTSPENTQGTNVRVQTFADDERIAAFVERCFRGVYERSDGYAVWASEI